MGADDLYFVAAVLELALAALALYALTGAVVAYLRRVEVRRQRRRVRGPE
jgi:hypothetical protein